MSRTYKDSPKAKSEQRHGPGRGRGRQRSISVRAIRRDPPDLRKLARALIQLALDELEAEASQSAESSTPTKPDSTTTPPESHD